MATVRWIGNTVKLAQTTTLLVGSSTVGHTFITTINGKSLTYTAITGDTTATIATAIQALLAGAEDPEFQKITWTVSSSTVTGTANTAGEPYTVSKSGTGTYTLTTTQANSSPSDVNATANYSGGAVPSSGDTLVFEATEVPARWNLESTFTAVDFTAIKVRDTFTGTIGNPDYDPTGFLEYRGTTFTAQTITALEIAESPSAGAGAYRFNSGSTACALTAYGTGGGSIGDERIYWRGAHASNTADVIGASVAIAVDAGQTATLTSLQMAGGAVVRIGAGTYTTIEVTDSTLDTRASATTLNINGASQVTIRDASAFTTIRVDGGTLNCLSTGTIATLLVGSGGTADFSGIANAVTVTNCTIQEGATILDPLRRVTWSNGIVLNRTEVSAVTLSLGSHVTLTVAAGP